MRRRWSTLAGGGLIVLATLLAYGGSFSAPFVFDDLTSIAQNATIRHFWPIGTVLNPPSDGGLTVGGRPIVNLSLAMNYAPEGTNPWGYHAVNLAIHILAALTLFGIVRRTLARAERATFLAFAIALLWALHPLQTESVTYIVQRAESLMGLFYLLTLYCFIRGVEADEEGAAFALRASAPEKAARRRTLCWFGFSWLGCLFGMATKEVMASAPLLVLLYDRTFVAGTFRESWRLRRRLHLALASTWIVLGGLIISAGDRGGTAGWGRGLAASWTYGVIQLSAIVHYLRLSAWPHPLVFDYGTKLAPNPWEAGLSGLFLLGLLAGTVRALRRRSAVGFAGAWFFLILAPSSSVVPVATQTMAEHRMYLPLAAIVALAVVALHAWIGRWSAPVFLAVAVALGLLSMRRDEDYRSALVLWGDTVAKCPGNGRAEYNFGDALVDAGRGPEAIAAFGQALRLEPDFFPARYNLAKALAQAGRLSEAIDSYEKAVRLRPENAAVRYDLGIALSRVGRWPEAVAANEEAVRLAPDFAEARGNLGNTLSRTGRIPEAIGQFEQALRLKPDFPEARSNLGNALRMEGRTIEAIAAYEEAVRLKPDYADARFNLGNALVQVGRVKEAIAQYERVLELRPDLAVAHRNLGLALRAAGQSKAATVQFEAAAQLDGSIPR